MDLNWFAFLSSYNINIYKILINSKSNWSHLLIIISWLYFYSKVTRHVYSSEINAGNNLELEMSGEKFDKIKIIMTEHLDENQKNYAIKDIII